MKSEFLSGIRAGHLRTRVEVDAPTQVQDTTTGEELPGWSHVGYFHAAVEPLSGREALRSDQVIADMDTRITTRWSSFVDGITAKHRLRVKLRGREIVYDIVALPAEKAMRRQEAEFTCKSGINNG